MIPSSAAIILAPAENLAVLRFPKVRDSKKIVFRHTNHSFLMRLSALLIAGCCALSAAQAQPPPQPPPQPQKRPQTREGTTSRASKPSPLATELQARLAALAATRQSNDAAAVIDASRRVAAVALRRTGQLLVMRGAYPQAEEVYVRSIDFEDAPGTHLDLCMAYLAARQPGDCLSETSKVILRDPQNAAAWRVQSEAWKMKADYSHAAESLKQAEALPDNPPGNPEDKPEMPVPAAKLQPAERARLKAQESALAKIIASALNDLGTSEARESKFDLALAHFHEAERWQPTLPGLTRNIGLAAERLSNYPEAVRALRGVVAADPHDQLARTILGTALFSTNAFAEAAAVFTPLGDSALQEPGVAYAWAESLIKINKFSQAGALLDKLERQPLPAETFILIAQARSQMGDYPHAVAACRRALESDPNIPKAHYIAGLALVREGRSADAEAELRAELQLDPNSVDAQYNLAFVLLQQSRNQEAVGLLERVVEENPNHAEANYELGKQLLSEGKTAEAVKYLEAAARLSPRLAHIHYQLQSAYRALGRQSDADRELRLYREIKDKGRTLSSPATAPPAK